MVREFDRANAFAFCFYPQIANGHFGIFALTTHNDSTCVDSVEACGTAHTGYCLTSQELCFTVSFIYLLVLAPFSWGQIAPDTAPQ